MTRQTTGLPRPRQEDLVYDESREDNKKHEEEDGEYIIALMVFINWTIRHNVSYFVIILSHNMCAHHRVNGETNGKESNRPKWEPSSDC